MSGERSVSYTSLWMGQLCGREVFVELEIYNLNSGNWSWRSSMFDGLPSSKVEVIWRWDYRKETKYDYRLVTDFKTREEAYRNASERLVSQGFGLKD